MELKQMSDFAADSSLSDLLVYVVLSFCVHGLLAPRNKEATQTDLLCFYLLRLERKSWEQSFNSAA